METILRFLDRRTFAAAGAAAALLWALTLLPRREPPPNGPSEPNEAIARELDARESLKLRALHRKVSAEISAARDKGLKVGRLQELADSALALDRAPLRDGAMERLNKLRLAVPQAPERFRPAAADEGEERVATPKSRPGKAKRKPARKGRRR